MDRFDSVDAINPFGQNGDAKRGKYVRSLQLLKVAVRFFFLFLPTYLPLPVDDDDDDNNDDIVIVVVRFRYVQLTLEEIGKLLLNCLL